MWELIGFSLLAALEIKMSGGQVRAHKAPLRSHIVVAVSMSLARGLTNMSLQYLNYPTQVNTHTQGDGFAHMISSSCALICCVFR